MSKNTQTEAPKQGKNVGYRLLAALFFLACVAVLFIPVGAFTSAWAVEQKTLINTVTELLKSEGKLFGALPAFFGEEIWMAKAFNLAIYLRVVTLVVAALLSLFAIFSSASAPRRIRAAVILFTLGAALYALTILGISNFQNLEPVYDLYTVLLAVVGLVVYCILALVKLGKAALVSLLQLLLSFAASGLLIYALTEDSVGMTALFESNALYKTIYIAIIALACLCLFFALIGAIRKDSLGFDVVRYVLMFLAALGACYVCYAAESVSKEALLLALDVAAASVLQLIIALIQLEKHIKKKAIEAKEEVLSEFETETYVEAYDYVGGPVEGVEVAEEVTPTMAAADGTKPDLPSLIGNGFDPFMSTLTPEEKSEFIDLYILRCKGIMPEIPAYVVGDLNKEFFNRVFIYLGQYRDKISSVLLQKMYDYSMKV